ncbi:hypothetical protein SUDANB28_05950 [Streptomyces sp. enrichment culture]
MHAAPVTIGAGSLSNGHAYDRGSGRRGGGRR